MSLLNMPSTCFMAVILWLTTGSSRCQTPIPNVHGGLGAVLGVSNASVLLQDPSSETLYLGARGSILALHTSNLTWKHPSIKWEATEEERKSCMYKGKREDDCYNYICLLEVLKDGRIYVCGSYAYNPKCAFIDPVTFVLVKEGGDKVKMENGKGKCPYDPRKPHTAVTADGVLYTASPSNFLGTMFDITRATGQEVHVHQSINWLSDPEFVSSALVRESPGDDDKIYFFFMENALEYDLYTKVRVTRLARVCKGDVGGSKTLQKRWTSFLKAQLVCQDRDSGQHYTVLTHTYPLEHRLGDPSSTHFYTLFTSQGKGERVSAVCVYSLADITKVFATGGFRDMKRNCVNSGNSESVPDPRPGQCINDVLRAQGYNSSFDMPDPVLQFAKEHPLLTNTVDAAPLLVRRGTTYTRITATNISNSDAALLHLGTDQGELHSVSIVGRTATLLQEIPLTTSVEPVNNILTHQGHVVVGSPSSLSRVPVEGCRVYSSCQVCARAAGLGCVWDVNTRACVADSPVQRESEDPLKVCGTGEGRCSSVVKKLRVKKGLVVLLPCEHPHLSPLPCVWEHPQGRHTQQHHSHLEVTVSGSSLGLYSCRCSAQGDYSWGSEPCLTASYQLTMEDLSVEGRVDPGLSRSPVWVYVSCVLLGVLVGALGATVFLKRLCWRAAQHTPLEDRNGGGANQGQQERGPTCYENKLVMGDTSGGQSGEGVC
ncbi:semaphorin-4F isoform X1 [Oncorhynchus tshawytscha]|uniref:Sema domain-containing protein n=1 Tax=Oncorhynchus tshawytscha TaxID=74940 RepID=A0AAZ3NWF7_ONCTS|nr:semaphorin-4F isoform X1 [Oncorhynchus tshawytscha]XP_042171484.1 semaphorin-4F isoform X1 [Oncorhynchus tshawytscha]